MSNVYQVTTHWLKRATNWNNQRSVLRFETVQRIEAFSHMSKVFFILKWPQDQGAQNYLGQFFSFCLILFRKKSKKIFQGSFFSKNLRKNQKIGWLSIKKYDFLKSIGYFLGGHWWISVIFSKVPGTFWVVLLRKIQIYDSTWYYFRWVVPFSIFKSSKYPLIGIKRDNSTIDPPLLEKLR